jgi:hypothetical protein
VNFNGFLPVATVDTSHVSERRELGEKSPEEIHLRDCLLGDFRQRKYQTHNTLTSLSVILAYAEIQHTAEKLTARRDQTDN